jgi:putative ATPase
MLQAGEDPRFIARRIVISAAEDVGNADPMALVLAESAAAATDRVGMPECQLPLAQAAIYLACAEKSRASAVAVSSAMEDVRSKRTIPVPRPLRAAIPHGNTPAFDTTGGSGSGAAEGDPRRGGAEQTYFGVEKLYYTPTDHGAESLIRKRLSRRRATEGGVGPRET